MADYKFEAVGNKRIRVSGPIPDALIERVWTPEMDVEDHDGNLSVLISESKLAAAAEYLNVAKTIPPPVLELLSREYPTVEPPPLRLPLFDYQRDAVSKLIGFKRAMLFDAPGMGKTAQALAFAAHFGGNVLVVAPKSNQIQWSSEGTEKFLGIPATVLTSANFYESLLPFDEDHTTLKFAITTYAGGYSTLCEPLRDIQWNTVIFDESHALKTPTSLTTRRWVTDPTSVGLRARQVLFLTGTPLSKEKAAELFGMVTCCFPELKMSVWNRGRGPFAIRYCDAHANPKWEANGVSHVEELRALMRTRMIRRPKEVYLRHLPSKTRTKHEITFSAEDMHTYKTADALCQQYLAAYRATKDPKIKYEITLKIRSHASDMRRLVGVLKSKYIAEYMRANDFVTTHKTIYFCEHERVRDVLMDTCEDAKIGAVAIYGDVSSEDRIDSVEHLRDPEEDEVRIGVFSIKAAGAGLNCAPGVHKVVFAELPWNSTDADQCEDRAHRVGTTHPIQAIYMVALKTIDENVMKMHERKSRAINLLIDDGALPDRGCDSPLILEAVRFGIDVVLARDLERAGTLVLDPNTWNDATITDIPAKTYVPMKHLPDGWFEWDGVSTAGTRWIASETEFTCVSSESAVAESDED